MYFNICDVPGIKVGHWTDSTALTGCTVVLCTDGAVVGVDVRGSAPGTRETDLARPVNLVDKAHAVVLSGGSAYGLDAACGCMKYLEEKNIGFDVGVGVVPIVPAAVLFDLTIGDSKVRPDAQAGYIAAQSAISGDFPQGNVGAGTGATVGKLLGPGQATKSGLGSYSMRIGKGIVVGAIVAVNAFGDIRDPDTGKILAGTRKPLLGGFLDTEKAMLGEIGQRVLGFASNTTIGVVATNAQLTKEGANKVAQCAHNGYARAITPVHTMFDGDTIFALSTGTQKGDVSAIAAAAAQVMAQAVKRAALAAESAGGLPAARDIG